jgi:hypothetical protein
MKNIRNANSCNGGRGPPKPLGFIAVYNQSMMIRKGRTIYVRPHASVTCFGARVASQRCPILRAGIRHISLIADFDLLILTYREEPLDRHMEDR